MQSHDLYRLAYAAALVACLLPSLATAQDEAEPPAEPAAAEQAAPAPVEPADDAGGGEPTTEASTEAPVAAAESDPGSAGDTPAGNSQTATAPASETTTEGEPAEPEMPWEYDPYKVHIWIGAQPAAELPPKVIDELRTRIQELAISVVGAPWRVKTDLAPPTLRAPLYLDMDLVTPDQLAKDVPEALNLDKVLMLGIRVSTREMRIEAREFDCRLRDFGPAVVRTIRQPDQLVATSFASLLYSFRAVSRIDHSEQKRATIRLRAGGLVTDPTSVCGAARDDILRPYLRRNDRDGTFERSDAVPWAFLQIAGPTELNPNVFDTALWGASRNPIRARASVRKELYALKVRPVTDSTRLVVMSKILARGDVSRPLSGFEIYAKIPEADPPPPATPPPTPPAEGEEPAADAAPAAAPPPKPKKVPPELIGRTSYTGECIIPRDGNPLRLVYIKNGNSLLARLPMVPGLDPTAEAEVPDDAPRLQAEGVIKGMQGQVMDLVAQRQILAALIRKRIAEGRIDDPDTGAAAMFDELRELPTRQVLMNRIVQAQRRQQISSSKSVQARIDKLYSDLKVTLGKYLDPNLIGELNNELQAARRTAPPTSTPAE